MADTHQIREETNQEDELSRYPPHSQNARQLAYTIDEKLSLLAPHNSNYGSVCIYKVPQKFRKKNPLAYTPRSISIGPLHYGQRQLLRMEEYKLKYLSNFLHTFRVPSWLLAAFVERQEKLVYGCYEITYISNLKKRLRVELSQVILLDGIFMIELFLKTHFREMRESGDIIFENPWVLKDILHDLLLFENQLPMGFLSSIYDYFVIGNLKNFLDDNAKGPPSFIELAQEYFKNVGNTGKLAMKPNLNSKSRHLVEFNLNSKSRHLVEFLAILHMDSKVQRDVEVEQKPGPSNKRKRGKDLKFAFCPTATELLSAGVKFIHGKETCLFDIDFNPGRGELKIPHLLVNDLTETFFCNLIAFEQTGYDSKSITSYVILLDNLIDTPKDVDILIQQGIIINQLPTSEQVAEVFNNLYKEVVTDPNEFHFAKVCLELTAYNKSLLHKWRSVGNKTWASLKQDYFSTPLSSISVAGAIIVIVLTFIQTVCSLISVV